MASDIASFFNPNLPREVRFHVAPDVRKPNDACYVVAHEAGGVLLEWRIGGYPPETVFVPWANIIAITPL